MLCRRCAARFIPPPRLPPCRTFTSTPLTHHPDNPPAATSTSAAQPFSTPFTPSPSKTPGIPPPGSSTTTTTKPASHPPSSTLAGTPLRGLGYLKPPAPAPIAREDAEYPAWLWTLLSPSGKDAAATTTTAAEGGDAFAKSKKQRRMAARAARARVAGDGGMAGGEEEEEEEGRKVERQRQSVDLAVDAPAPVDGGAGHAAPSRKGQEEREGLQRAMRKERRGRVREGNFLRGMR